jgi:hypothetical protein
MRTERFKPQATGEENGSDWILVAQSGEHPSVVEKRVNAALTENHLTHRPG